VAQPPAGNRLEPASASSELWLRPGDLSLSLSNIENNERLQGSADLDHVYGVGFFLGGTSMLSLAGAQFDPGLYQASCEQQGVNVVRNGEDLY
jgi:predicted dienelactone hydrolase